MKETNTRLTVCACRSRSFISTRRAARLAACAEAEGCEVELVADLCQLCRDDSPQLQALGPRVAACHPRAVEWLLRWRGVTVGEVVNLRQALPAEQSSEGGADEAPQVDEAAVAAWMARIEALPRQLGSDAWFPVVDKSACAECGKCLDFCPFGVYDMVDERLRVVHPHQCKNNCPACARTCPAGAIIFPKYERSPINGGTEQEETAVGTDTSSVLYADALRQRLQQRRVTGTPLYKIPK